MELPGSEHSGYLITCFRLHQKSTNAPNCTLRTRGKIAPVLSALLAAHFSHMSQHGTDGSIKTNRFGPRAREAQRELHVSASLPKKNTTQEEFRSSGFPEWRVLTVISGG